jgi:hypothetical protein
MVIGGGHLRASWVAAIRACFTGELRVEAAAAGARFVTEWWNIELDNATTGANSFRGNSLKQQTEGGWIIALRQTASRGIH